MSRLRKIISRLDEQLCIGLEEQIQKNRGANFLFLIHLSREGKPNDKSIRAQLGLTSNAFYARNSRPSEKVQKQLARKVLDSEILQGLAEQEIWKQKFEQTDEIFFMGVNL